MSADTTGSPGRLPALAGAVLRPALAVVAAVAVAFGTAQLGPLALAAPVADTVTGGSGRQPVRQATLVCPGPETEGLVGVPPVAGAVTTVYAAAAPALALGAGSADPGAVPGTLSISARPDTPTLASIAARGPLVSARLTGPTLGQVVGSETLAPGVAALQTSLVAGTDDRGLSSLACPAPLAEVWLLGGGGDSTRRERIVVANAGANVVTVDVEVFGEKGRRATTGTNRIAVPAHGRVSVLLDGIALGERSPAVHVVANGGLITALLEDAWIEAAVGRGRDDAAPANPPALEQVVPAAPGGGPARLRLLVPGEDEAVVQVRLLTASGPLAPDGGGVVRVRGASVLDVDLGSLPQGEYAVQVQSDRPVTAAVQLDRRGPGPADPSDLAWVAARAPVGSLAGLPIPGAVTARLVMAGTGRPWSATVWVVGADGSVSTRPVRGDADTAAAAVDVSGATSVWVGTDEGTVYAGLRMALADPAGPLFSIVGLSPLAVTAAQLPVRQVRR